MLIDYPHGPAASSADRPTDQNSKLARAWARVREQIVAEHRGLEQSNPLSPRIRPSTGAGVGFILAGGAR